MASVEKSAVTPADDIEEVRERWPIPFLKLLLRPASIQLRFVLLGYTIWHLIRHWFNFFCDPWSFDDILMGRHVPWPLAIGIFAGAIAWAWKCQGAATFRSTCACTFMFHLYQPEIQEWPFIANSIFACIFHVWIISYVHICNIPATRSHEDSEAAHEDTGADTHATPSQHTQGRLRDVVGSVAQSLARRLPTTRTAIFMAMVATVATVTTHPPEIATEFLAYINCEAHATKLPLDYATEHFEFTTTNRNIASFTRSCSQPQQAWALSKAMTEYADASKATCGVMCIRRSEAGELFGYISHVNGGLVDMYYCRGDYNPFGPDCEAEGEEYGYDVGREGWMDDIFEPWSVLEEVESEG